MGQLYLLRWPPALLSSPGPPKTNGYLLQLPFSALPGPALPAVAGSSGSSLQCCPARGPPPLSGEGRSYPSGKPRPSWCLTPQPTARECLMTSLGCLHPYLPWPAPLVSASGSASFFLSYSHILASQAHGVDDITYHRHLLSTRHWMGAPYVGLCQTAWLEEMKEPISQPPFSSEGHWE